MRSTGDFVVARYSWGKAYGLTSKSYTCGHCGNLVATERGFLGYNSSDSAKHAHIYICHFCSLPTFFEKEPSVQVPAPSVGKHVHYLPTEVDKLYKEARVSLTAGCPTATALCCRTLLLHIAVSKGAQPGLSFARYIDYLVEKGYISSDASAWLTHVRQEGNRATHEIVLIEDAAAYTLLSFMEVILKTVYEFPGEILRKRNPNEIGNPNI